MNCKSTENFNKLGLPCHLKLGLMFEGLVVDVHEMLIAFIGP